MSRILGTIGRIIRRVFRGRTIAPTRWQWSYRCEWTDAATGDLITTSYRVVEIDSDRNYQRASALARRLELAHPPDCGTAVLRMGGAIKLTCHRVGDIIGLPE